MSTQFLLDEDDIKELTKLMLVMIETQESRKQLCRELGINPQEVSFIIGTSDDTFCTELIDCLNRYGYQEYLCKLCCDKLFPILNKSVYSHRISILKKIIEKINCNCNQEKQNHPIPTIPNPDESKSESWFTKIGKVNKKLLASGAIILIVLAGYPTYKYLKQPRIEESQPEFIKEHLKRVNGYEIRIYLPQNRPDLQTEANEIKNLLRNDNFPVTILISPQDASFFRKYDYPKEQPKSVEIRYIEQNSDAAKSLAEIIQKQYPLSQLKLLPIGNKEGKYVSIFLGIQLTP